MRIGIVAQEREDYFGVHQDYYDLAEEFGTPVLISPVEKEEWWKTYGIDGLILPGGADVDYRRYGAWFGFRCGRPNTYLEYFDNEILPLVVKAKLPIFGICRGLQSLNVFFGGTLHQHLWRHPYSQHKQDLVHNIHINNWDESPTVVGVNSFHHQAINKLAPGLSALAVSDDNLVEAIGHESLPIFAVQWHPERIHDEYSLGLMDRIFS